MSPQAFPDPLQARFQIGSLFVWQFKDVSFVPTSLQRCVLRADSRTLRANATVSRVGLGNVGVFPSTYSMQVPHMQLFQVQMFLFSNAPFALKGLGMSTGGYQRTTDSCQSSSGVTFILPIPGLAPGSLYESELAKQGTLPLRSSVSCMRSSPVWPPPVYRADSYLLLWGRLACNHCGTRIDHVSATSHNKK